MIKMKENSVTKHLLDGHFFSIWSQSWLRNWPMRFMLGMLSLYHQQAEKKCMLWLKIVWINWSRASRESVGNKCIDGAHRLCVRWDCHKISITWGPSVKYLFFSRIVAKSGKGKSSWTVGFKQRKTRRDWCGLLMMCFAAAAEEGSFYFV